MLKFINDNDFLLVDKYKQNDDGSVSWTYKEGHTTHSGIIREDMTRDIAVQDGTEQIKVGTEQVQIGTEEVLVEVRAVLDDNGEPILDDNGDQVFEDVFEDVPVLETRDVFEEHPKFIKETVDIWAKLQRKASEGEIEIDTLHLLGELKDSCRQTINSTRDALNNADIELNGHSFQADEQSKNDIMGAVITGTDTIWLTRSNEEVAMSAEDMRNLGIAIANRKKVLVYKARNFKDHLDTMADSESIHDYMDSLDWSY